MKDGILYLVSIVDRRTPPPPPPSKQSSNPPEQFAEKEAPLEDVVDLLVEVDMRAELGRENLPSESSGLVELNVKPSPSQGWWSGELPERSLRPRLIGETFLSEKQ